MGAAMGRLGLLIPKLLLRIHATQIRHRVVIIRLTTDILRVVDGTRVHQVVCSSDITATIPPPSQNIAPSQLIIIPIIPGQLITIHIKSPSYSISLTRLLDLLKVA